MARPTIYKAPRRINIIIDKADHDFGRSIAKQHRMRGGFSEFLRFLIRAEKKRKGRQLMAEIRNHHGLE